MQTIATKINKNSFKARNSEVWEKNSERSDSPDKHSTNSPIHQHILSNILFFYMQDQAVRSCCVSPASKHKVMTCGHCTWSDDTAAPRTEPQSVRIEHVTFTWLGLYSIWTPALSPVPWLLRQNLMFWTPFFLIYCINRTMFSCTPTLGIKKERHSIIVCIRYIHICSSIFQWTLKPKMFPLRLIAVEENMKAKLLGDIISFLVPPITLVRRDIYSHCGFWEAHCIVNVVHTAV